MPESVETLGIDQLKEVLLSADFQRKLASDIWSSASFGVAKTQQELMILPSVERKFPDMTPEFIEKAERNQKKFNPRTSSHIKRLTDQNRTTPENYFGLLCAYYGIGKDGYSKLPIVASSEGIDTTFFWSFGPYIAQELRYHDVQPSKIMEVIIKWGAKAKHEDKHLPGTSKYNGLNAFMSMGLILDMNPESNTHKFSQGVSRILCAEQSIFKNVITETNPMKIRDTKAQLTLLDAPKLEVA